jgi:hypothetical protein
MSPTKLTLRYPKATRGEGLASLQSAQMNHRRQFLLLRQADLGRATSSQSIDHLPVEVRRGHFGRMARQSSSIEAIEPAGLGRITDLRSRPYDFGCNTSWPRQTFRR